MAKKSSKKAAKVAPKPVAKKFDVAAMKKSGFKKSPPNPY